MKKLIQNYMEPANELRGSMVQGTETFSLRFLVVFLVLMFVFCGLTFSAFAIETQEIYRILVPNIRGGSIEVSINEGTTWETVGHVVYPTTKVNPKGYTASQWIDDGSVAASAVNALHIKVGFDEKTQKAKIFSILPKELIRPPKYYKTYLSPNASIYTDITAGTAIFGGGYVPIVGNKVTYFRRGGKTRSVSGNYVPQIGDMLEIVVERPKRYPKAIVFENRFGGEIIIEYHDTTSAVIGQVLRPVLGIGRFEGSKYTASGRIRANHPGVIGVSVSPENNIAGFQIIPANHAMSREMLYARIKSQWMVVGPPKEGTAPLFKDFIYPDYRSDDLEQTNWEKLLLSRALVQVKYKGGDEWKAMPVYSLDDYLSGELPQWAYSVFEKVSHFRVLFPI